VAARRAQKARPNLLVAESFQGTFGKNARRKRPRIDNVDLSEFSTKALTQSDTYEEKKRENPDPVDNTKDIKPDKIFEKGQSKRIWGELYKVRFAEHARHAHHARVALPLAGL
jgi:nuclear GTP-binding protein